MDEKPKPKLDLRPHPLPRAKQEKMKKRQEAWQRFWEDAPYVVKGIFWGLFLLGLLIVLVVCFYGIFTSPHDPEPIGIPVRIINED